MGKENCWSQERKINNAFSQGLVVLSIMLSSGCTQEFTLTPTPTKTLTPTLRPPFKPTLRPTFTPTPTSALPETHHLVIPYLSSLKSIPTPTNTATSIPRETPTPKQVITATAIQEKITSTPAFTPITTQEQAQIQKDIICSFSECIASWEHFGIEGFIKDIYGLSVSGVVFVAQNENGFQIFSNESGIGENHLGKDYQPGQFSFVIPVEQKGRFNLRPFAVRVNGNSKEQPADELVQEIFTTNNFYIFSQYAVETVPVEFMVYYKKFKGSCQQANVVFQAINPFWLQQ